METREFRYEVGIVVVFIDKELDLIKRCCQIHYDGRVKSAAKKDGFVYGWLNMRNFDKADGGETEFVCGFSQLDTVGKALEQPASCKRESEADIKLRGALWFKITTILKAINAETNRVNTAALEKQTCFPS